MNNLQSKIFLVTGGTSGVGKATAMGLAERGAKVVIISRDKKQCELTLEEITQRTGNDKGEYLVADLSLQSSIKTVAEQFKSKYDNLHTLANCMGAIFNEKQMTEEGIERTFAVNYMSHFGLTNQLLDILKASRPSRIITVTGNTFFMKNAKINFDDVQCVHKFSGMMASAQAMSARLFFTFALAEKLKNEKVTVNAFNAGVIKTKLLSNAQFYMKLLGSLFLPFEKDVCDVTTYLSTSEDVNSVTGRFFNKDRKIHPFHETFDPTVGNRLWEYSEDLLKSIL